MTSLLQVEDLEVRFYTKDGEVQAVNGVSYSMEQGDTLGLVGESGCGKSVSTMAMLRLIPEPPGRIAGAPPHHRFRGPDAGGPGPDRARGGGGVLRL